MKRRNGTKWRPRFAFPKALRQVFEIDLRSLALFRISVAVLILRDLWARSFSLEAHYTDFGVLPRTVLIDSLIREGEWSFHLMNGSVVWQAMLFVLAAVFGFSMLVGYRTRISVFASWVMMCSLHNRNPLILQGGDMFLRLLLFWAMFLPLGARYSVDHLRKHESENDEETIFSFGSAGLLLQVSAVYVFTAVLKSGKEWIPEGTAVYYALHIEQFAKPLGVWLRQFPALLRALTFGTWYLEAFGPILFFMPVCFLPFRLLGIALIVGLHMGLHLCMELGHFPFVSSVAMVPFLPAWCWNLGVGKFLGKYLEWGIRQFSVGFDRAWERCHALWIVFWKRNARVVGNAMAGGFIVYVAWWNLTDLVPKMVPFPYGMNWIADVSRVDQVWNMFAPYPLKDDGWYVVPGTLEDGTPVDIFRGVEGVVSWEPPKRIAAIYSNDRWRSYFMSLADEDKSSYRLYYAQYICREWNRGAAEGKRLATFEVDFMSRVILPDYKAQPVEKLVLWEHDCLQGEVTQEGSGQLEALR